MFRLVEKFQGNEVFAVILDDEPDKTKHWFRATQVCKVLEYSNTKETLEIHCKPWQYREFKVGQGRPALYVCLSGLFRLTLRSKSPIAIEFQDWVSEDVLPKLFASGVAMLPHATSEAIAAEWEAQGKEIAQLKEQITKIASTKQKASLSELELMVANRDVKGIEAELMLRGTRMTANQKQLVLQGMWV